MLRILTNLCVRVAHSDVNLLFKSFAFLSEIERIVFHNFNNINKYFFIQKVTEDFENNHSWMAHTRGRLLILRRIPFKV